MEHKLLLRIVNFQAIEFAEIELRGMTLFVGVSNQGKSSVIRALRAILYNDWNADYLLKESKMCELTLFFPDTFGIKEIHLRKNNKGINEYRVTTRDGNVLTSPKTGQDTPDIIKEHGFELLTSQRGDKFNMNFQGQLEPLFMMSPSEASGVANTSLLNTLFDVEKFEKAMKNCRKDVKNLDSRFLVINTEIDSMVLENEEAKAQLALDEKEQDSIQPIINTIDSLKEETTFLNSGILAFDSLSRKIKEADVITKGMEKINSVSDYLATLIYVLKNQGGLLTKQISYEKKETEIYVVDNALKRVALIPAELKIILEYINQTQLTIEQQHRQFIIKNSLAELKIQIEQLANAPECIDSVINCIRATRVFEGKKIELVDLYQQAELIKLQAQSMENVQQPLLVILETFNNINPMVIVKNKAEGLICQETIIKNGITSIEGVPEKIHGVQGFVNNLFGLSKGVEQVTLHQTQENTLKNDIQAIGTQKTKVLEFENWLKTVVEYCPSCERPFQEIIS